ncbi:MAG: hypothetical protein AAF957_14165 [Planctomycetota bacterium]
MTAARWVALVVLIAFAGRFLAGDALRDRAAEAERGPFSFAPGAEVPVGLLVTLERAPDEEAGFGADGWTVAGEAFAASTSRHAALASLLSGDAPPVHGCRVDGERPGAVFEALTETLVRAGVEVRTHGGDRLPAWAGRGVDGGEGGLREATAWLTSGDGPRFAHVHAEELDLGALEEAAARLEGAALVVTSLPEPVQGEEEARFLGPEAGRVLLAWRGPRSESTGEGGAGRPRSQLEIAPTLFDWLGARVGSAPDVPGPIPRLDEELVEADASGPRGLVVTFEHRTDGRPHLVRARTPQGTLDVEATPLDPPTAQRPVADWALLGPTQDHVAYRNALRVAPQEGAADADSLVRWLAEWMEAIGVPKDGR